MIIDLGGGTADFNAFVYNESGSSLKEQFVFVEQASTFAGGFHVEQFFTAKMEELVKDAPSSREKQAFLSDSQSIFQEKKQLLQSGGDFQV